MRILKPSHNCVEDFLKIFESLDLLNFFIESSILDVWSEPESASGSIRFCFLELIDCNWSTLFCSYFIALINV